MKVAIGYDPREEDGFDVTKASILKHNPNLHVAGIYLDLCKKAGLYSRPTVVRNGHLFDLLSDAPMATEFALTRFLIPWLFKGEQWVLFMDCDMLATCDIEKLMDQADERYAIMCVKHAVKHEPGIKMDGCVQTTYARKNWSSVMLWNLKHPAHKRLTLNSVNILKGAYLHQFCWLADPEIGELSPEWNHLVGVLPENSNAKIVHYTLGIPSMPGYEDCEYSAEWKEQFEQLPTSAAP